MDTILRTVNDTQRTLGSWTAYGEPRPRVAVGPSEPRMQPEHRLMVAILADALRLMLRHPPRSVSELKAQRATAEWFADDDRKAPFSFLNLCRELNLDAARVRRLLPVRRTVTAARA
jgi:hypothetical protein